MRLPPPVFTLPTFHNMQAIIRPLLVAPANFVADAPAASIFASSRHGGTPSPLARTRTLEPIIAIVEIDERHALANNLKMEMTFICSITHTALDARTTAWFAWGRKNRLDLEVAINMCIFTGKFIDNALTTIMDFNTPLHTLGPDFEWSVTSWTETAEALHVGTTLFLRLVHTIAQLVEAQRPLGPTPPCDPPPPLSSHRRPRAR